MLSFDLRDTSRKYTRSVYQQTPVSLTNLTCTIYYDVGGDSPKEPIESDCKETDQSPDSNQDVPSSINKLKKRLLKCTPSRLPTPPAEQKKTPAAQIRKTPTDVLLTGKSLSRGGKSRSVLGKFETRSPNGLYMYA